MIPDAKPGDPLYWPKSRDEVDVDVMLRHAGADAQMADQEHWHDSKTASTRKRTDAEIRKQELYTLVVINTVGFMNAMRALREVDPAKAIEVARDHWEMCDDGSTFGEMLWQWLSEAGLDPSLIKWPEDAQSDPDPVSELAEANAHMARLVAAVTDFYVGPDPEVPEDVSRRRLSGPHQRCEAWLSEHDVVVPDWRWRKEHPEEAR